MTKQSDKFFQDPEVKEVLTSRAKTKSSSVCVSGEDIGGTHYQYSSEYLHWNMKRMWVKVTVHLDDEQRKQWFIDNPPPENKFK
ncbi:conserved hypothetical protein [Vibrio phage 249E41-1]|nr:conserved hypothetical protein [Vibrio phage 249E41-1]